MVGIEGTLNDMMSCCLTPWDSLSLKRRRNKL